MSGPIKMSLGPLKKALREKLATDYSSFNKKDLGIYYERIHASVKRLENLQSELYEIPNENNDTLITENESLITQTHDHLAAVSSRIGEIDSAGRAQEKSDMEKMVEILTQLTQRDQPSTSSATNDKLADVLDRIIMRDNDPTGIKTHSQLPKLYIKKFYGNILEWPSFYDSFQAAIGSQKLTDGEKFNYLKSLLAGSARQAINGLPVVNSSYATALTTLKTLFGNKHLIISSASKSLRAIKPSDIKPANLRKTFNEINNLLSTMELSGEDVNHPGFTTIILEKFPPEVTLDIHKKSLAAENNLTINEVRELLNQEILARQQNAAICFNQSKTYHAASTTDALLSMDRKKCIYCTGNHYPDECKKEATVEARLKKLGRNTCIVCLRKGHTVEKCRSTRSCAHCKTTKQHHRSLCPEKFSSVASPTSKSTANKSEEITTSKKNDRDISCLAFGEEAIMQTAVVIVVNGKKKIKTRLMLDNGSSRTYISSKLAHLLGLKNQGRSEIPIRTFNEHTTRSVRMNSVEFSIQTIDGTLLEIKGHSIDLIAHNLCPKVYELSQFDKFEELKELPLAPNDETMEVQILIGSDYELDFLRPTRIPLTPTVALRNTVVGWIIAGRHKTNNYMSDPITSMLAVAPTERPQATIRDIVQFYELENIGIVDNPSTQDEDTAVAHFNQSIKIQENRYFVSFPWKEFPPRIPTNYALAQGRLRSLLRQLKKSPDLLHEYHEAMMKNLELGIIERVPEDEISSLPAHYIPHHGVFKPNKKLRIVYDASAHLKNQPSLNECMYRGPLLLENLCGLIINFRHNPIAIVADIERAFLEIGLNKPDRDYVRFLWISSEERIEEPYMALRFARVPFGTISSPFLLNAVVHDHLQKSSSSMKHVLINRFYVDNLITGVSNQQEAIELYTEAKRIFNSASMNLRQWTSNSKSVNQHFEESDQLTSEDNVCSVLGLHWNFEDDTISLKRNIQDLNVYNKCTKRNILAVLASFFDPCGYFLPHIIHLRIFMQNTWQESMKWDEEISKFQEEWNTILLSLPHLYTLKIPRFILTIKPFSVQLHCFADASQHLYAAAIYLRVTDNDTKHSTRLIFSKARLKPLSKKNTITIPRMELLAATLGARILQFVRKNSTLRIDRIIMWSDSQCVISWFHSRKVLPVFIRNRIQEMKNTGLTEFRHVSSTDNPADFLTKPTTEEVINELWWTGPQWLSRSENQWKEPTFPITTVRDFADPTQPSDTTMITHSDPVLSPYGLNHEKFSSLPKLWRITSYITKFIKRSRGPISRKDIEEAQLKWIQYLQQEHFSSTLNNIRKQKTDELQRKFSLYLDEEIDVLRCGNRFLNEDNSAPILLPKTSSYTRKLILHYHTILLHSGVSHTLCMLRKHFWLPCGRQIVRKTIRPCTICKKVDGRPYKYPDMPPLPSLRTTVSSPFQFTGLDYFGPLLYRTETEEMTKAYGCIFTCFTTRAIHLELVPNMSLHQFSLAVQKFCNRRGTPNMFYSDNATQFKAFQELHLSYHWEYTKPLSPWQGGLYEKLVDLTKRCLKKSFRKKIFTFVELQTILTHVEAVLNTRPLCYIDDDENTTNQIITPAHFLNVPHLNIITNNFDRNITFSSLLKEGLINLYKRQQSVLNTFWHSWRGTYLQFIKERNNRLPNKQYTSSTPQVGIIVQISDNNKPRINWKTGRVMKLNYGRDGRTRSADIRLTNRHILTRPINSVYPIEECS